MFSLPNRLRRSTAAFLNWAILFLLSGCGTTPEQASALCPAAPEAAPEAEIVVVWAASFTRNCWYHHAAVVATQRLPLRGVAIDPAGGELVGSMAEVQLLDDLAEGAGPDLALTSPGQMNLMREAGFLTPLDECVQRFAEFEGIRRAWWQLVTVDGQIWGIPFDADVMLFFYHKGMLRELGWTETQIEALPQQIAQGTFTMHDVLRLSRQATARGIAEPGFGYWPEIRRGRDVEIGYPALGGMIDPVDGAFTLDAGILRELFAFHQELGAAGVMLETIEGREANNWSSRLVYRDTVVAGRVLFWKMNSQDVARIWADYPISPQQFLEMFGVAALPSLRAGQAGAVYLSLATYVVPNAQAAGRDRKTAVCELLAQMVAADIGAEHAVTSFRLPAAAGATNEPIVAHHPFLSQVEALLQTGAYYPFQRTVDALLFRDILVTYMLRAEGGELTPEAAVTAAIAELQAALGPRLLVEQ